MEDKDEFVYDITTTTDFNNYMKKLFPKKCKYNVFMKEEQLLKKYKTIHKEELHYKKSRESI